MATGAECITHTGLRLDRCDCSVFLNSELYCLYRIDGAFTKISNLDRASITQTTLASPSEHHRETTLTGYKRSHIFKTGGIDEDS